MPLQIQTLGQLRDEIKREARVDGSNNLDVYIVELINELLLAYSTVVHYRELLVIDAVVTAVAAVGSYDLPEDFESMKFIRYRASAHGTFRFLDRRPQFVKNAQGRYPNYYDLAGDQVLIFPFEGIKTTDTITFDYYKYPDKLVDDDDVFPLPKVLVPLKRQAIARAHLYNRELQVAAAFKGESTENETRSRNTDTPNRV